MRVHSFINYTVIDGEDAYDQLIADNAGITQLTIPSNPQISGNRARINAAMIRVVAHASSTTGRPCAYFTRNGSDPDTSTEPIFNGDVIELYQEQVSGFRIIGADANNQSVHVEFGYTGRQF